MRIFALELNNDINGIDERKAYIEVLISALPSPDLVLLPELSLCGYIPNQSIWKYADNCGKDTAQWAKSMAAKYGAFIGVGYVDLENGDYYNRYMIADGNQVYGSVTKSEAEAAVFKRGWFDSIIPTPFGNIAVAICYDANRRHFYENIKDEKISLICFPHGSPGNPKKDLKELAAIDNLCNQYLDAFEVPVVYTNSYGALQYMPGTMGFMMKLSGFKMNGKTKIFALGGKKLSCAFELCHAYSIELSEKGRKKDIKFYGDNISKGNFLFRHIVLKPDIRAGIRKYKKSLKSSCQEK